LLGSLHKMAADFQRVVSFGLYRASTYDPLPGFTTVKVHFSATVTVYSIRKFCTAFDAFGWLEALVVLNSTAAEAQLLPPQSICCI